jgi:hypothetical protein
VLWSPRTGLSRPLDVGSVDPPYGVAFAPDGRTLYTAGYTDGILAWDVGSGTVVHRFA